MEVIFMVLQQQMDLEMLNGDIISLMIIILLDIIQELFHLVEMVVILIQWILNLEKLVELGE